MYNIIYIERKVRDVVGSSCNEIYCLIIFLTAEGEENCSKRTIIEYFVYFLRVTFLIE